MDEVKLWSRGLGEFVPRLPALLNLGTHETLSQSDIDRIVATGSEMSVREAMIQALVEASRGFATTSPNPLVGCVILDREGRFLSKGFHEKFGEGHAEVQALKGLREDQLLGAHLIVTLEPCAHQGKTPSCAKKIAELPLSKVTYGLVDPNPLVAGKGAQIIRDAGIQVEEYPELKQELSEICEAFLWNQRQQKIFVAAKVATTLDGCLALKTGESQWITGEHSRYWAHELRGTYDATLVGVNTVLQDNPSLSIRHPRFEKINRVVVLDSKGRGLQRQQDLKIFSTHDKENLIWVVNKGYSHSYQGQLVEVESTENLEQVLQELWKLGLRSLLVEGGAQILSNFLKHQLVQRLYLFQAPRLLGSLAGQSWTKDLNISSLDGMLALKNLKVAPSADDFLLTGVFNDNGRTAK